MHTKEPEWLYQKAQQQVDVQRERDTQTHQDKDKLRSEAKDLRAFAKEFGRGVCQQRARGKTKENAGTLPLALSMMRRNGRHPSSINILEEFQCLEEQTEDKESVRSYSVAYNNGDVVALKHNYKRYVDPFFLAVLVEDLHKDGIRFVEENLTMKWLEESEEDPLV